MVRCPSLVYGASMLRKCAYICTVGSNPTLTVKYKNKREACTSL